MRIAFLKQGKELGIHRHVLGILEVLRQKGAQVEEFDLTEGELQEVVQKLLDFAPLFVLDINASGVIFGQREDGQKVALCDAYGFVHVSLFTDEPLFYYPPLLDLRNTNNFLAVFTDLKYADSLRFLGLEKGSFYITPFVDPSQMVQPSEEKDIEVLFFGPVIDPAILASQVSQNTREDFIPFFFEVGEFLFRNPEAHILYVSEYLLSMFNPQFQEEFIRWRSENPQDYLRFLNDISLYATARKRWYLLSFLEGINLKIVGAFEGELKEGHEHVKVEDWREVLELVGRSYVTILSYPHAVPTGVGFLPLEVAYMGSAPLIDYRATLPGFFIPEEEVITYLPLDRADIEEKVVYYLENLQQAKEIGERARQKVLERYTPEDRGEFLLNTFNNILAQAQSQQNSEG
jgi:glycosyltransferase involved in cell wall biosynthesis